MQKIYGRSAEREGWRVRKYRTEPCVTSIRSTRSVKRFAVFMESAAKCSEAPCTLFSVRPLHCKEQRPTQTTSGKGVFWTWNWEVAHNKDPGPGRPPHRLQGFSPHLLRSFYPSASSVCKWFSFFFSFITLAAM